LEAFKVNTSGIASSLKRRISDENIILTAIAVIIIIGLYLVSCYNYLLFHGIIKCICIGIAITIFVIIWNSRPHVVDTFLLVIAVSFLFSGCFEILHMLAFSGMGVFPGDAGNLAAQVWIAGRYFQSVTLVLAVFSFKKSLTNDPKNDFAILISLGTIVTIFLLATIFLWQVFPTCFIPGSGPTSFMIANDYIIAIIMFAAIALLLIRRREFDYEVWQSFSVALFFLVASELTFAFAPNMYGFVSAAGHIFTLVSYYFFYRSIVVVAIRRPSDIIFRRLKENEDALQESESRYRAFFSTSPYGVYMTSREGKMLDYNDSLIRILGYGSREELKNIDSRNLYAEAQGRNLYTRTIKKEGYIRDFPFRVKKKDGTLIDTLVSAIPLKNRSGEIIGFQGTVRDVTLQKRAESALRESEERYRTLFEESPVPIWEEDFSAVKSWMDAKSREGIADWRTYFKEHPEDLRRCASRVRILHINRATTVLYGISSVQELTSGLSGIFTEESYESFKEELACFAEKTHTFESERPIRALDGKPIATLIRAAVVPGYEETFAKVLVTVVDITGLKKAESALRESEGRYRALFEESPTAIREEDFSAVKLWMDAKSQKGVTDWEAYFKEHPEDLRRCASLVKIVHINRAMKELYEVSSVEEFTSGLPVIFIEASYPSFRDQLVGFAKKTFVYDGERPIRALDGKIKATLFKATVVPGYEETLAKVIVTVIDITQLKQAEATLRESEDRYRSIIENIRDVSFRVDKESRLVMISPSAAQTFGVASTEELLGKPVQSLWKYPEKRKEFIISMKKQGGTVQDWETEYVKADGTSFWVSISAHMLTDEHGEYAGGEGIVRDITARKKIEAALKNALNKLNMLSSITRHDIQNQLLALRGYLELSRKMASDKAILDMINKEDAIAETIGKQIEFTKTYEDIGVNEPAWHDIGALIQSACTQLPLANIEVITNIPPVEIYADALIGKVIYNFIENSLRHGVHVTRIAFSFLKTNGGAVFVYEDNGIGIHPEDKQYLFQKGFGKHTGLGLFLSQQILAITGLTIRETGEFGKGVRFEIRIPEGEYRVKPGP